MVAPAVASVIVAVFAEGNEPPPGAITGVAVGKMIVYAAEATALGEYPGAVAIASTVSDT
jgi:hypothetical protein